MTPSLSLCVTAYQESSRNNCRWLLECLEPAIGNSLVREIVVVNDGTDDWVQVAEALQGVPKLKFVQNPERLHVFGNKLESVYQATGEWVLLCDSDNVMRAGYYNRLAELTPWDEATWYAASLASPTFDYRKLEGRWTQETILAAIARDPCMWWCFVNTGNQLVHRQRFLGLFGDLRGQRRFDLQQPDYFGVGDRSDEKWLLAYGAQDSFYLMKTWLLDGGTVECVAGLTYDHRCNTGDRSNYVRAPDEKRGIGPAYALEIDDANRGQFFTYRYQNIVRSIATYLRSDGRTVRFNMATGEVL